MFLALFVSPGLRAKGREVDLFLSIYYHPLYATYDKRPCNTDRSSNWRPQIIFKRKRLRHEFDLEPGISAERDLSAGCVLIKASDVLTCCLDQGERRCQRDA